MEVQRRLESSTDKIKFLNIIVWEKCKLRTLKFFEVYLHV